MFRSMLLCGLVGLELSAVLLTWLSWQESCGVSIALSISLGVGFVTFVVAYFWRPCRDTLLLSALYLPTKTGRTLTHGFILSLVIGGPMVGSLSYLLQVSSAVECASHANTQKEQGLQSVYKTAYVKMSEKINDTIDTCRTIASTVDATVLPLIRDVQELKTDYELMSSVGAKVKATCMETLNDIYQHCSQKVAAVKEYCEDILSLSHQKNAVSTEELNYLKELKNHTQESLNDMGQHNYLESFSYLFDLPTTFCEKLDLTMHMCKPIKSGERICSTVTDPYQRMKRTALDSFDHLKKFRSFFSSQGPLERRDNPKTSSLQSGQPGADRYERFNFSATVSHVIIMLNWIKYGCLVAFLVIPIAASAYQYKFRIKRVNKRNDPNREKYSKPKRAKAGDVLQTVIHLCLTVAILLVERTLYSCLREAYDRYYAGRSHNIQPSGTAQLYSENSLLHNSMEKSDSIHKMLNTFLRQFESLSLHVDDTFLGCLQRPALPTSIVWLTVLCLLYVLAASLTLVKQSSFRAGQRLLENTTPTD